MKKQALVNIYHFIRKSTYNDGVFTWEDFDTLKNEMDILKQHQLPATYALKHDAVMDAQYTRLIKSMVDEKDEIGAWWEITQEMADKAGVTWKGCDVIDLHVKAGYSLAYTPEERKKLIDVYMKDFKEVYGYYPKTIGSWVMDIVSFEYAKEKYGVIGGALCRDQKGIDGFTLWGGYVNGAYYPSKVNENIPAQSHEMQVDMPIFKLLGPDPIYNFEAEVREGAGGIYTLEPAWTCGQSETWVKWLFDCITKEEQLGYGYTQAGQENSFIWGNVGDGFEMQMRHIANLRKENKIRVESLRDSSLWFKKKYQLTPPVTYTATNDWNETFDLKTTWYSSRFYRSSLMLDKGVLSIRDLYIFDEQYPSRYLNSAIDNNESIFDALPILNACYWSTKEQRASIEFVNLTTGEVIAGQEVTFEGQEDDKTWIATWTIQEGQKLVITHTEAKIHFELQQEGQAGLAWGIRINTLPVLREIRDNQLICEHENFTYKMEVEGATCMQIEQQVFITPVNDECSFIMNESESVRSLEVFQTRYLEDSISFDAKVEATVEIDLDKISKIKLIKPILSHRAKVKQYDEIVYCTMTDINEESVIHYTLNGEEPTGESSRYTEPIEVKDDCVIKARAFKEGRIPSDSVEAKYFNTLPILGITSETQFDPRKVFNRNGANDLIDGEKGSLNYVDNCWLITTDVLDVVLDLGEARKIKGINVGFMQSKRSGPCYPEYVTYYVSKDGEHFEEVFTQNVHEESGDLDIEIKDIVAAINVEARYVKVKAKPYKFYFIFTDEIIIQGV
ncbi:MAG: FN3 associated domain-containing protein [Niameybacter sp.]